MTEEAIDANEAESSTSTEVQETPTDDTALSSSAEGEPADGSDDDEVERSLQDIVADAAKESLESTDTEEPPSSEDQEQAEDVEAVTDEGTEQTAEDELNEFGFTEKEWETVHDKTKTRMQDLLAQRSEFKESAEQLNLITGFMEENKISSDAMASMMGSLAKFNSGDYQGFVNDLTPLLEHAGTAIGHRLPEDIQQKVDQGYVDLETATELARTRITANDATHASQREQFNAEQAQNSNQAVEMQTAVNAWEADIKSKDVDYDKKATQIRINTRALMAQYGTPANREQAVQLAKDAYEMTNDFMKQAAPPPRAIKPGPSSSSASHVSAEPKSMLDAVRIGIKNAHTQ